MAELCCPFILVLLIGVMAGTYSSMLIGPQVLVMWEKGRVQDDVASGPVPNRRRPRPTPYLISWPSRDCSVISALTPQVSKYTLNPVSYRCLNPSTI